MKRVAPVPGASWQRCRAHFMRNLLSRVPGASQDLVATVVRSIYARPDKKSVEAQHAMVVDQLEGKFPDAATMLDEARDEILAFATFPEEHWRQIWSNNTLERPDREIRGRTDVVGIFPNRDSVVPWSALFLRSSTTSGRWPDVTWASSRW